MDLNSDDCIGLWVKVLRSAKGFHADGVFLQSIRAALKNPCGKELEKLLQCDGVSKARRFEDPLDLFLALIGAR
jgi:hypothetical protein